MKKIRLNIGPEYPALRAPRSAPRRGPPRVRPGRVHGDTQGEEGLPQARDAEEAQRRGWDRREGQMNYLILKTNNFCNLIRKLSGNGAQDLAIFLQISI